MTATVTLALLLATPTPFPVPPAAGPPAPMLRAVFTTPAPTLAPQAIEGPHVVVRWTTRCYDRPQSDAACSRWFFSYYSGPPGEPGTSYLGSDASRLGFPPMMPKLRRRHKED